MSVLKILPIIKDVLEMVQDRMQVTIIHLSILVR